MSSSTVSRKITNVHIGEFRSKLIGIIMLANLQKVQDEICQIERFILNCHPFNRFRTFLAIFTTQYLTSTISYKIISQSHEIVAKNLGDVIPEHKLLLDTLHEENPLLILKRIGSKVGNSKLESLVKLGNHLNRKSTQIKKVSFSSSNSRYIFNIMKKLGMKNL